MDQVKIGRFIAECRKKEALTQMQLAEKMNITDRAVSKWENGKAMPDSSIMLDLCDVLKITVNDLLCGEVVTVDHYNKELENNLLEMIKQKEQADKRLLSLEIFIGVLCIIIMVALVSVAFLAQIEEWLKITLILIGFIPFVIAAPFMLKIEQTAGYYECAKCAYRYVPKYSSVFWAAHVNRTRYMRCPKCNKRTWQKKVLSKE